MSKIPYGSMPVTPFSYEVGRDVFVNEMNEKYGHYLIYAIDPYVFVWKIRENVWAMLAPCTHRVEDNWIYLIEGPEKALFIDNGYGVGDLRGLGELLTGKKCITAPTHFHGDHAGGSGQFDEVYCHKFCADIMRTRMNRESWDAFNHVYEEDQRRLYYLEKDMVPFWSNPTGLENHAVINLGEDYDIELIHVGGHAPGESCYLDKKGRILYTGDAYFESRDGMEGLGTGLGGGPKNEDIPHAEYKDFTYYMNQTLALAERASEWDYCMPGHGPMDSPGRIVTDCRDAIVAAVTDPENWDEEVKTRFGVQYYMRRGLARVRYDLEKMISWKKAQEEKQ